MNNQLYFFICAGGIFVCYFYFGIMQEDITSHKYVHNGKRDPFTYTLSLVFFQCVANTLFALAVRTFKPGKKRQDTARFYNYAIMAISYLGAMLASNHALQYVPYPTQVIGKSIKPIPVMMFGVLFASKRYPLPKFLFILMITVGVGLFMYSGTERKSAGHIAVSPIPFFGELLLLLSLAFDGVTGAVQERVRYNYMPSGVSMMFNCNLWSSVYLAIAMVATGEVWTFASFAQRHPIVLGKLLSFSVASALGQNFIFMAISQFGSLTCSIITTTRKFFTVLASVIYFSHPLLWYQWIGVAFVFVGLGLDAKFGKERKYGRSEPGLTKVWLMYDGHSV